MSRANAAYALPPGDRDAPPLPLEPSYELHAGRETDGEMQRGGADLGEPARVEGAPLLPGLTLIIEQCGPALDEAQIALGDLKLAQAQNNLALFKSSARRLADLPNHVATTAKNYRAA